MTLEQMYGSIHPFEEHGVTFDVRTAMLDFIQTLNSLFPELEIYGLTSHSALLLFPDPKPSQSLGFVSVEGLKKPGYEYRIAWKLSGSDISLHPQEYKGIATSVLDCITHVLIAMRESRAFGQTPGLQAAIEKLHGFHPDPLPFAVWLEAAGHGLGSEWGEPVIHTHCRVTALDGRNARLYAYESAKPAQTPYFGRTPRDLWVPDSSHASVRKAIADDIVNWKW